MSVKDPSLHLRKASTHDLAACAALDTSFPTRQYYDLEWQPEPDGWTARLRLLEGPHATRGSYDFSLDELRAELRQSDLFLVADLDGDVAGFCNGHHARWNNTFFIHNLFVAAPYRGRGIGTAFIDEVMRYARGRRIRAVVLATRADNVNAVRFYCRRGFRLSGFRDDLFSNRDVARHRVALYLSREVPERRDEAAEG